MVIIVLSQVLNNNLVPDCVRSNLRGSKFKIFLGEDAPTSTSCHSIRGPHRDHCHPGQPYHARNTLLVGQYGVRIVTYSSVVKLWFTRRASARAVAPDSPIPFPHGREFSKISASSENQLMAQSVGLNIGLCHH